MTLINLPQLHVSSQFFLKTYTCKGEERGADSELTGLEQLLALHGSQKVIAAYMNLRKLAGQEGMPGEESHDLLKNLLVEMHADIGRNRILTRMIFLIYCWGVIEWK